MDRRSFLAASAVVFAGCGQQPSTETSTPTETATQAPTETATDTPTETATGTPTETETPELNDREQRAARALDRAITELTQAVATYAGASGDSVVDVSAATTSFSRVAVVAAISDADDHIERARTTASGRQQPRLAAVVDAREFLSLSTEVQRRVIAAFEELQRARDAVDDEQEGTIESATRELRSQRDRADDSLTDLVDGTSAETVSVVPAIPSADYEAKVAQFGAEIDGFGSLADFLNRLLAAVVDLNAAERFDRVESERMARERARQAAEAFEALTTELREFVSTLPEGGAALEAPSTDLADIAESKAAKARELEEDNS